MKASPFKSAHIDRATTMCKIQCWGGVAWGGDTRMNEMKFLTQNGQNKVKEKDMDIEEML